jgi:DNA-binding response OmpR family regulator
MEEIIVIRMVDTDESVLRSILETLQGKDVQILHAADFDSSALTLGDIEIFPEQRRVTKAGVEICLNYGEFSILYCMARCPGRVFSREQLYNAAWGEEYELGTNTVDNTIWRLRNKLEPDPRHPTYIKTVFRVGYKIEK